jgi:cyclopropane-fatty-acyl-phospholipid synthase
LSVSLPDSDARAPESARAPGLVDPGSDRAVKASLEILRILFRVDFARNFEIAFWDGTRVPARERQAFTLRLNAPFALRAMIALPVDLKPGLAFAEKWVDIEGDIEAAVDAIIGAIASIPLTLLPKVLALSLRLPQPPGGVEPGADLRGRRHSKHRDAAAIGFHYDQPLSFYRSFLTDQLIYSCAYYDDGVDSLEEAQRAKIDYVLRKIRLQPGETLLDIGCGWGALVVRAAQHYGATALGITLSREQHIEASRRIALAGLGDRARVEYLDYRELGQRTFDKIVSIGMVEHVGREQLRRYFAAAWRALRGGGLFLNHGIGQLHQPAGYRVSGFMQQYVFPDGDLMPIAKLVRAAELAGFEIRDVENLREHYTRTLRSWVRNLEANQRAAVAATDERTYRIWRLYMGASAQGFRSGRMAIYQTLMAKPRAGGSDGAPATRRHLYTAT